MQRGRETIKNVRVIHVRPHLANPSECWRSELNHEYFTDMSPKSLKVIVFSFVCEKWAKKRSSITCSIQRRMVISWTRQTREPLQFFFCFWAVATNDHQKQRKMVVSWCWSSYCKPVHDVKAIEKLFLFSNFVFLLEPKTKTLFNDISLCHPITSSI